MSLLGDDLFSSGNNADDIGFDRAISAFPLDGSTDIPKQQLLWVEVVQSLARPAVSHLTTLIPLPSQP
jgi:hypothetical protein